MKRFDFPLEKLRTWRQTQYEIEEGKLETLIMKASLLVREREQLEDSERTERSLCARGSVNTTDLAALAAYLRYCEYARAALAERQRQADNAVVAQRQYMIEAKRRLEMLNKLKERRKEEWRKALDSKEEEMVAELVVGRWKRSP